MQNEIPLSESNAADPIEYVDERAVAVQWVETITLPTYSINHGSSQGRSKFGILQRNYAFIKHMMNEIGLRLNCDYIIIPDTLNFDSIDIKFSEQSRQHASMCVLVWGRYKEAKFESKL